MIKKGKSANYLRVKLKSVGGIRRVSQPCHMVELKQYPDVSQTFANKHQSAIEGLMYIAVGTRPLLSERSGSPAQEHWIVYAICAWQEP